MKDSSNMQVMGWSPGSSSRRKRKRCSRAKCYGGLGQARTVLEQMQVTVLHNTGFRLGSSSSTSTTTNNNISGTNNRTNSYGSNSNEEMVAGVDVVQSTDIALQGDRGNRAGEGRPSVV